MFTQKIDNELKLALTTPNMAQEIFDLVDKNRDEFSKWSPWVEHTKEPSETKEFIKQCIKDLADGKHLHTTIVYKNKIVGLVDIRLNLPNKK